MEMLSGRDDATRVPGLGKRQVLAEQLLHTGSRVTEPVASHHTPLLARRGLYGPRGLLPGAGPSEGGSPEGGPACAQSQGWHLALGTGHWARFPGWRDESSPPSDPSSCKVVGREGTLREEEGRSLRCRSLPQLHSRLLRAACGVGGQEVPHCGPLPAYRGPRVLGAHLVCIQNAQPVPGTQGLRACLANE